MTIHHNDPEHRLIAGSRTFAFLEVVRGRLLLAIERSRILARLPGASRPAVPWQSSRYALGVLLATAATTHVVLAAAAGALLGWTALIIPAVGLVIGVTAIVTSPPVADDRSGE
jgi:hypothetical protein